jgi:small-conductance mechanosensitive channel
MLALASLVALALHAVLLRLLKRACVRFPVLVAPLVHRAAGPTRLALLILAWGIVLRSSVFRDAATAFFGQFLLAAFVVLVGWSAIAVANLAADIYLRRFVLDAEDNFLARKQVTQVQILRRTLVTLMVIVTVAGAMIAFDSVRQLGISLLASAGAAGLIVGLAAQPVLSNLIAGVQLALTQPIRLEDAVVVEGEWGWIEEINATYVVIRLWDWRRLIVPLRYFIENPFQNWTRKSGAIIGAVTLRVDYRAPVDEIRARLEEIVRASPRWNRGVVNLQVTEADDTTITLRALASAATSPAAWDLRCEIREKLIGYLREEHPDVLPRQRYEVSAGVAVGRAAEGAVRRG